MNQIRLNEGLSGAYLGCVWLGVVLGSMILAASQDPDLRDSMLCVVKEAVVDALKERGGASSS